MGLKYISFQQNITFTFSLNMLKNPAKQAGPMGSRTADSKVGPFFLFLFFAPSIYRSFKEMDLNARGWCGWYELFIQNNLSKAEVPRGIGLFLFFRASHCVPVRPIQNLFPLQNPVVSYNQPCLKPSPFWRTTKTALKIVNNKMDWIGRAYINLQMSLWLTDM